MEQSVVLQCSSVLHQLLLLNNQFNYLLIIRRSSHTHQFCSGGCSFPPTEWASEQVSEWVSVCLIYTPPYFSCSLLIGDLLRLGEPWKETRQETGNTGTKYGKEKGVKQEMRGAFWFKREKNNNSNNNNNEPFDFPYTIHFHVFHLGLK